MENRPLIDLDELGTPKQEVKSKEEFAKPSCVVTQIPRADDRTRCGSKAHGMALDLLRYLLDTTVKGALVGPSICARRGEKGFHLRHATQSQVYACTSIGH